MAALDDWKAKAVSEPIKLEHTGTLVQLRLPDIKECFIAGGVPMEILNKMAVAARKSGSEPEPDTVEDWQADMGYRAEMVRRAVAVVEGEPVTLTPEDVAELDVEDRNEIYLYASRAKPLPLRS